MSVCYNDVCEEQNIRKDGWLSMKKTLEYFTIDGAVGGNQEWFKNVVMYIGGCAAATACDCCICLALGKGMERLYPYDIRALCRKDYVDFSMKMKPYLKPRVNGVNKLYMFTDGMWITAATYGNSFTFSLRDMWDTGYEEKGGLIGLTRRERPGTIETADLKVSGRKKLYAEKERK